MNQTLALDQHVEELSLFFQQDFHGLRPFDPLVMQLCEELSQEIFNHPESQSRPDFMSLAFWLRKTHIHELHQAFLLKENPKLLLLPRGIAFHIPPANIDVMLVYSWICSLLAGNGNVIRLPGSFSQKLLSLIQNVLQKSPFESIQKTTKWLRYGHEDDLTAWISDHSDIRIVWGGDETIHHIRKIPLNPRAKEIVFPDRFSYAVIHAEAFQKASLEEQKRQINYFFNDAFLFDQAACSSPRILFWIGDQATIHSASQAFYRLLEETIEQKGFAISLGGTLLKKTYTYNQAINLPVKAVYQLSNELTVLVLKELHAGIRIHCGQGLIYHASLQSLQELKSFPNRQDQTLTYYGFTPEEMKEWLKAVNGRGIDRVVPFGQALNFDVIWDGQDLLTALTQQCRIK